MDSMLAGDVAQFLGKSPSTVRWYSDSGKLPSTRSVNGVRIFQRRDVERFASKREQAAKKSAARSAA